MNPFIDVSDTSYKITSSGLLTKVTTTSIPYYSDIQQNYADTSVSFDPSYYDVPADDEYYSADNVLLEDYTYATYQLDELLNNKLITFTTYKGRYKGKFFTRTKLGVEVDYPSRLLAVIFTHGKSNYKIWFINTKGKLCVVDYTEEFPNGLNCHVTFDVNGSHPVKTIMSLDRFLYLVEAGEFKITNKKFIEYCLYPVEESKAYKSAYKLLESTCNKLGISIPSCYPEPHTK